MTGVLPFLIWALVLVSCGRVVKEEQFQRQLEIDSAVLQALSTEPVNFEKQVKPILDRRCVVCHGCYDAPCQLKLSSEAGITRGASKERVYNGARFFTMQPTRLFVDAHSDEAWRAKGFHSVLNETETNPAQNLDNSVMYRMLRLKHINQQPDDGLLPEQFDLSLGRKQFCTTIEEFPTYENRYPMQGMPFAMPNLKTEEFNVLSRWIAQGAPMSVRAKLPLESKRQIKVWETFFNGASNKQQLISRYLYEHLFQAHLHFKGSANSEFYRLIRSRTPAGTPAQEIATVRPYGDPGGAFYYRLVPYPATIVAKNHVVYELSEQRMARFRELFLEPDYPVPSLPTWEPAVASNPFKAFAPIPHKSRYQFLLDDARFFIEGFIKGPVCRGQIALNVIEDNFWVVFVDPDLYQQLDFVEFLESMVDQLEVPSAREGAIRLLSAKHSYRRKQQRFNEERLKRFAALENMSLKESMRFIWDGDGTNPNAALSIFRHFDSASVAFGFVGDYPETAWIIDYPQLERIHYLLVAGFNVFGNLKHQLNTRLYMDYLRMEGEDNFLAFIPSSHRQSIRDSWYVGMRQRVEQNVGDTSNWATLDVVTGYKSDNPQQELYATLEKRLAPVLQGPDLINRCKPDECGVSGSLSEKQRVDAAMATIAGVKGIRLRAFPDVAFIRVELREGRGEDLAYTVIRNKAYKNVTSLFKDESDDSRRDYTHDSLTVVDWLEGSYPNFFFRVAIDDIERFVNEYAALVDREGYERFVANYGVRRTNPAFWETADWFHERYSKEQPVLWGLFDLNRYENR